MKSSAKLRHLLPLLVTLGALVLASVASANPKLSGPSDDKAKQTQIPANSDTYELGPEDVLTIYVRNVPEMTGDYLVQLDGTIYFPVVGQVKAGGMSAKELKAYLEKGLGKELRDPQVTVNIKQLRPNRIYIYGSVAKPGVYDYRKGWRLSELIALAGGLALPPERLNAVIFRPGNTTSKVTLRKIFIDADDASDLPVQPGDSVNIQAEASVRVQIVGEAKNPGEHQVYEGQGAIAALASGGGETAQAALSRAKILRNGQEIPVDLYAAVIDGDTSKDIKVQDNDQLIIPQQYQRIAVSGQVNKPGSQLLPDGRPWTLSMAISEAGGCAAHSVRSKVNVIHTGPDGKTVVKTYDVSKLGVKKNNPDVVLSNNDVVFVPESGATNLGDVANFGNLFWIVRSITGL